MAEIQETRFVETLINETWIDEIGPRQRDMVNLGRCLAVGCSLAGPPAPRCATPVCSVASPDVSPPPPPPPVVSFVNPLEVDGFAEEGGWGDADVPASSLPLLVFLPGMDGSLTTPFMQYPELGSCFELSCLVHAGGLGSRASFDELASACASHVAKATRAGRNVVVVGESFGATLAISTVRLAQQAHAEASLAVARCASVPGSFVTPPVREEGGVAGLVLVNPATSYARSTLARVGPLIASCRGPLLPFYPLGLLLFASLVLSPATQAPAFIAMCASLRSCALLATPEREAFLGRVALGAFLGRRDAGFEIGELLKLRTPGPADLGFRLEEWLQRGAEQVAELADEGGESALSSLGVPAIAVVGEADRLLPSADEASRLEAMFGELWRGTVFVPGAGHGSTLGNRVDLLEAIRSAFGPGLQPPLRGSAETPHKPQGEAGDGWDRGMVEREFEPLDPGEYTQWNRRDGRRPTRRSYLKNN